MTKIFCLRTLFYVSSLHYKKNKTAEDQTHGPGFPGVFIQVPEGPEKLSHRCETRNSNPLVQKRIQNIGITGCLKSFAQAVFDKIIAIIVITQLSGFRENSGDTIHNYPG
mgnify:CR=1